LYITIGYSGIFTRAKQLKKERKKEEEAEFD
jgi:hypothetical protein